MLQSTADSRKKNNAGFSLVELIVVVSILAIAAVPLIKSLGLASRTNAKAQSLQNATSIGEAVMEQMKATPVDKLSSLPDWTFSDKGTYYELKRDNATAFTVTQGEKFDVVVKIDKAAYSGNVTPVANKADNVKSANTLKLPTIADIDSKSQAVLSSQKELNKYDNEALSYFNQKIADYPTHKARINSKTIDIEKSRLGSLYGVNVKVTITYEDDHEDEHGNPAPNKYVRDLYTGTFVKEDKPLDSNIYIFYTVGKIKDADATTHEVLAERELRETINITVTGDYSTFSDTTVPKASHKVIFIRQDKSDTVGPTITFNGSDPEDTFTFSGISGLDEDGHKDYGDIRLITNLDKSDITKEGHIYSEDSRTRVYDITVDIYKTGESEILTSLNSTRTASDTPTPTPTPTTEP